MRTQALKGFTGFFSWPSEESREESANAEDGRWKPTMSAALPTAAVFRNSRRCKTGAVVIARYLEFFTNFHPDVTQNVYAAELVFAGPAVAARWMALRMR